MTVASMLPHTACTVQMLNAACLCAVAALPVALAIEADYVIVGGGTAGCALAARLCAGLPDAQVTLLERGAPRTAQHDLIVSALRNTFTAWDMPAVTEKWLSEPNPGLNGRQVNVLSGATLGGSSAINGAEWTRPAADVPAGWGVRGLTRSMADRLFDKAAAQLGAAPPPKDLQQTYVDEWLAAAAAAGVPQTKAPLSVGKAQDLVWINRLTADNKGRRMDACTAYLKPVMGAGGACARNLQLIQDAVVTKLQLRGGRAVGVEYLLAGEPSDAAPSIVRTRHEVVSCAGPYGSPKLLQLSGIGPAALLRKRGVPVATDLPVGTDAQARPFSLTTYSYLGVPLAPENNRTLVKSQEAKQQFLRGEGGVLGVGIAQVNGVFKVEDSFISSATAHPPPDDNDPRFISGCLINPVSRATVAISSADPLATVNVSTNILGDAEGQDVRHALACVERQRAIMERMPARFELRKEYPEENVFTEATMRRTSSNGNHFVGACAVGTVLDGDLRVKGYSNLRIVDASAIPDIPRYSGCMSSVYLLAEHAAEMVIAAAPPGAAGSSALPAAEPAGAAASQRAAAAPAGAPRHGGPAAEAAWAELSARVQRAFAGNGAAR
jgi:choline dehydrogenase